MGRAERRSAVIKSSREPLEITGWKNKRRRWRRNAGAYRRPRHQSLLIHEITGFRIAETPTWGLSPPPEAEICAFPPPRPLTAVTISVSPVCQIRGLPADSFFALARGGRVRATYFISSASPPSRGGIFGGNAITRTSGWAFLNRRIYYAALLDLVRLTGSEKRLRFSSGIPLDERRMIHLKFSLPWNSMENS